MDENNFTEPPRGVTLNTLLDEQRSLNMRLLLAVQLRDLDAQAELKAALDDVANRIDQLLSGTLKR